MTSKFYERIFHLGELGQAFLPEPIGRYIENFQNERQTVRRWEIFPLGQERMWAIVEVELREGVDINNMCFSCAHAEKVNENHYSRQPLTCDNRASHRYRQSVRCGEGCSHYWPSSQHEEEPE